MILAICGSLRAHSTNKTLLAAAAAIAPEVLLYDTIEDLPPFNPDLDIEPGPAPVQRFRKALREASAVVISTPEYAHGLPGALKNALDWVVGSGELSEKAVTLWNASDRGTYAQAALREVIKTMNARLVLEAEVTFIVGRQMDASTIASDAAFAARVHASIEGLRPDTALK